VSWLQICGEVEKSPLPGTCGGLNPAVQAADKKTDLITLKYAR